MLNLGIFGTFVLILIGLTGGMVGTLSGAGVGVIVIPIVLNLFNILPTSLVGSIFPMYVAVMSMGLIMYSKQRLVDYKAGLSLSIPGVIGAIIGVPLGAFIALAQFKPLMGLVIIALACAVLVRELRKINSVSSAPKDYQNARVMTDLQGRKYAYVANLTYGLPLIFLAGLSVSIFGLGSGIIVVPVTIAIVGLPPHIAIGTTRVIFLFIDLTALFIHLGVGAFDIHYAAILAVGGILGTFLASRISINIPGRFLGTIIALTFIILGVYTIIS